MEAEVSIDIVRRIYMYGIFQGTKEKKILDTLKKNWELKSNYYIGEVLSELIFNFLMFS